MISLSTDLLALILAWLLIYAGLRIYRYYLFPKLMEMGTKEVEKNPKWIIEKTEYYGFQDVDFVLVEPTNMFCQLPRFRVTKDTNRFQILIPNDIPIRDVDAVVRLALVGKIHVKYGVFYPDKPIYWLSILCYMLDGGDIKDTTMEWKKKEENSQETS